MSNIPEISPAEVIRKYRKDLCSPDPTRFCPSLVKITAFAGRGEERESPGFIFSTEVPNPQFIIVGLLDFISDINPIPTHFLISSPDYWILSNEIKDYHMTTLIGFDQPHGLLFLKYKYLWEEMKPAKLGQFQPLIGNPSVFSLNLHRGMNFQPYFYSIPKTVQLEGGCNSICLEGGCWKSCNSTYSARLYFHIEDDYPYYQGVLLDDEGNIIGFRLGQCRSGDVKRFHLMPMELIQPVIENFAATYTPEDYLLSSTDPTATFEPSMSTRAGSSLGVVGSSPGAWSYTWIGTQGMPTHVPIPSVSESSVINAVPDLQTLPADDLRQKYVDLHMMYDGMRTSVLSQSQYAYDYYQTQLGALQDQLSQMSTKEHGEGSRRRRPRRSTS